MIECCNCFTTWSQVAGPSIGRGIQTVRNLATLRRGDWRSGKLRQPEFYRVKHLPEANSNMS